ncbi:MAG: undecaprenyldiphospho-muramoylpentapeptide beta-N-acetylglucosaminyltransferase [Candidatus Paceibacterota bacterium]
MIKIMFTGGGTGGHVFPIVAIIREIRKLQPDQEVKFYYIGPNQDLVKLLLPQQGVEVKTIISGKIRRYWTPESIFKNLIDILFKIPVGFIQAFFYVLITSPDLILTKGGTGSVPVVWWGWLFWTPIVVHESDMAPGLSNKIASHFATEVFVSFPETEYFSPKKMIWVGNPVRTRLLSGSREKAREAFQLTQEKPVILVLGGSQGAQRINDLILSVLPQYLEKFEIIHQTGKRNLKGVKQEARVMASREQLKRYHPRDFLSETKLQHAYKAAELIISRAGAGVIFEVTALGKPAIFIPLPESAQDHQYKNANWVAEKDAGMVIEERNVTPHFLLERVKFLFTHPSQRRQLSNNAERFSKPRAGKTIAEYIIAYLKQ